MSIIIRALILLGIGSGTGIIATSLYFKSKIKVITERNRQMTSRLREHLEDLKGLVER